MGPGAGINQVRVAVDKPGRHPGPVKTVHLSGSFLCIRWQFGGLSQPYDFAVPDTKGALPDDTVGLVTFHGGKMAVQPKRVEGTGQTVFSHGLISPLKFSGLPHIFRRRGAPGLRPAEGFSPGNCHHKFPPY